MYCVAFDAPLEEMVDVQLRLANRGTAFRRQRSLAQWLVGLAIAIGMSLSAAGRIEEMTLLAFVFALALSLAIGAVCGYAFGYAHDWRVRRYLRRTLMEMFGGQVPVHCEVELRPDAVSARTRNMEASFPWSALTQVVNADDGIELWFNPGLVFVRSRVFATPEARHQFLQRIAELSPGSLIASRANEASSAVGL